jgi:hypothetical protein
MPNVTAEMANKPSRNDQGHANSGENTALDRCYQQIGISAVAAAVRYQGVAKNPAYAPVPIKWHDCDEAA